ncbi:MAG: ligase-associated DNA damage response exonuclease [Thermoanaerobaculia bacterium]
MPPAGLLEPTAAGLYCPAGGFYIDPCRPVARALITHAHADHARPGSGAYLGSREGQRLLARRLGYRAHLESLDWGEVRTLGSVRVSLHPAGHILGSAQVRLERGGEVWVVSGDYKTEPDPTCSPFEPLRCDLFVTEATFARPVFRWPPQAEVLAEALSWWRGNAEAGRWSVLLAYSLGKAQRLLAGLGGGPGPIWVHPAIHAVNQDYRQSGIRLPPAYHPPNTPRDSTALVLAPPGAPGSEWLSRFRGAARAFASGWMLLADEAGRRGVERGFVLSDHADWPGLQAAIRGTGAGRVWVTHGEGTELLDWLAGEGIEAEYLARPDAPG